MTTSSSTITPTALRCPDGCTSGPTDYRADQHELITDEHGRVLAFHERAFGPWVAVQIVEQVGGAAVLPDMTALYVDGREINSAGVGEWAQIGLDMTQAGMWAREVEAAAR